MLAKRHINSCFLYSELLESSTNVNSQIVLISQVWEKLQVFGRNTVQKFCFRPISNQAFQSCFHIVIQTHTLLPNTVNLNVSLYSKWGLGSGKTLQCAASLETKYIFVLNGRWNSIHFCSDTVSCCQINFPKLNEVPGRQQRNWWNITGLILLNLTPQTCMGVCFSGVVHYGSTNDR